MKKIFALFVGLICSFFAVAHAEEVDPYFAWKIKNLDDYQAQNLLFKTVNSNGIIGMCGTLYNRINKGNYSSAAMWCEQIDANQKVAFGTNYFDAGLTELTAKLYLETDELDKAERKIDFLFDDARDNVTKIRALNLKSDLLNRRGNYGEALTVTQETTELLRDTPDEKLNLINQSRAARAYCGLDDFDKSLEIANEILPSMQNTFGKDGVETLAALSTVIEICRKTRQYDYGKNFLLNKSTLVLHRHGKNNLSAVAHEKFIVDARALSEHAKAMNDRTLFFISELVCDSLRAGNELFKQELREKYSDNMTPKNSQTQDGLGANLNESAWNNDLDRDTILKNFDVQKNRQAIPDGACLVEFLKVSDDSLVVTFLRNDGDVQAANIPVDKNFFAKCKYYHELNAEFNLDGTDDELNSSRQKLSVELSEKLMPTLEKFAGDSTHWIISPDAELNLVPFETLIFRDKLLIESVDVSYVPSLAVMNLMKNRERKNSYLGRSKELFAMGDAVYGNTDAATSRSSQEKFFESLRGDDGKFDFGALRWNDLPGTAQELDKVSPLFDSKAIFRREQATEKNLRELNSSGELAKYKYLLFATHGLFVPKSTLSAIVLSQQFTDGEHDGYVTVGEWMGYDLRSDLIYLSACESGRGDELAGEGIVGIPYALTVAGNKDTVMSLWKVDDAATAEFTSAVFEKLSRGLSEVSALNETKREFLRHGNSAYKNPSVWAAFVLYGI